MSINIGDNFSYLGKKFLDNRQSFDTLELMNACSDVPLGFITFCKEDNKRYEFSNDGWVEFKSSITDEEAEKLNIAYLHSQSEHLQLEDITGFATEEFVINKIAEAELGGEEVDLSGYVSKEELEGKGYLTSIPEEYVTDEELNAKGYLTEHQDLSGYVSKEELEGKGYLTGIPEEYVTDEELNAKGYLTEHQDLSDYATKEYVDDAISNIDISGGDIDIDLSAYATKSELQAGLASKFDNVEVNEAETNDSQTALDFYANGEVVKTVYFSGGGGGSATIPPYISTILPENSILGLGGVFNLQLDFSSSVTGRGTVKIFVNDVESISMSIPQGENTIPMADTYFTKGNNRVTVYVIDRTGQMSNSLTFYVRYGSLEITSDFDAYTAYEPGAVVRYYFTPTAVDTSLVLTMYMKIDGEVKDGVSCSSDTRGYFTFPNNLEVGAHFCQAYVVDSAGSTSNVLSFNLIVLDAVSLVVASDTVNPIVEEGEQLSLDYKVYMRGATSFITKTYIDENLVNTGTCGLDFAYYRTSALTEGIHTIKMEVYDVTETVSDYIIWTVTVTPSTYEMLQPVKAGSLFIGTAQNMTNSSENKEVWRGTDQDGAIVDGILHNFAFNSESGWVDDELLISGASSVEIPITPLANNARYGFTLDIEFASKMIGVDDALVLNLWDDEKDCGIKITTEQVILRSAEGNQADLYFTDSEMTSVIFVIDRNETTAKIYLNGVMCSAFHLSDYSIDGVPYLEDFTVNNTIMLGGSGHARIKNLRVYQVALTTDEILNNFMANETRKAEQKALVEFQKGDHLPTLTIYCDFSGLGKDDKKPCAITYVSTDEEKYGKSFTLTHKKSTCQYQGTSSMAYPIKNYRINLADEAGNKWKYEFPFGKPEHRYTLKADFMSSGHWTNTGLTKWIDKNLYNYDLDDEKTMNPKKWYDINNGGSINDTRECIYGFPCRLILVNDGNTPLNEGQNEPTPGNTKDMGIFNFNHDKDATDTMGFDDDVFPNCASYEVTANSDTSAGAFMRNLKTMEFNADNQYGGYYYLEDLGLKLGDTVTYKSSGGAISDVLYYKDNNIVVSAQSLGNNEGTFVIPEDANIAKIRFHLPSPPINVDWITLNGGQYQVVYVDGTPSSSMGEPDLDYIKQSFELRFPDEDDVPEGWGFMYAETAKPANVFDYYATSTTIYTTVFEKLTASSLTVETSDGATWNVIERTSSGSASTIPSTGYESGHTITMPNSSNRTHMQIEVFSTTTEYIVMNGVKYFFNNAVSKIAEIKEPYVDETKIEMVKDETLGLKALIDWVDGCTDEEFVRDFDQHFHRDYTLRYFLLVITLGMVDNLGKNMMLDTWDNKVFMPRFYDCDTICSYDNSGQLKFDVDIEMAQGYWNTSSSRLWTRIRDLMHDELIAKYNNMRQNGLSYESLMECFYDEQIAKIPQKYYNMDYDVKYGPFADSYIGMANGDVYEHVKRWLQQRLRFVDTLYDYAPSYNNDVLTIRANTTEPMTLEIETYTPVYQHLSWYNNQMDKKKIDGKTSVSFTGTAMAATDQEVLIYGGSNIKSIKGISSMNPNRMLIGSATRLIELDAPNCPLLADINANKANLAPHIYLNKVNLSGCPLLGGNLIVNQSPLVREIDIRGTAITGLNLPPSLRNLEVLKLPAAISNLVLNDAGQLHTLELEEGGTLQSVSMTNCNALTNVTNFNLEDATSITLNNSYNTVNELYFSKATNLSVSNMANLERVIYTPNAEHEVFDKANVDNALNYTISTFNCPKLNEFVTTAPYRNSYGKDYGEKKPNEVFEANVLDISSTQFKDVKLLCTTDTNKLLLPRTVKNLVVDSAYDLDTELLTDGDYDFIHTDLYEPYNTDYEGEVYKRIYEESTYLYDDPRITEDQKTDYIPVNPNSFFKIYALRTLYGLVIAQYDKDKVLIRKDNNPNVNNTERSYSLTLTADTYYVVCDLPYNKPGSTQSGGYKVEYEKLLIPDIVPSASDGSLIFSMYAPHNTTEPASGTWDMKGLDFDTFHTFGLNNDIIQAEDGSITMPNRLDGYSYKIDNLRLPNEIANYTASDANTFPTFNAEFKYSYVINKQDGVYVYRILADDMDNLPTSISFLGKTNLLTVEYLNASNITTMSNMFQNCSNLTYVDISDWDTGNITNMSAMFYYCSSLTSLDVSNLDTGNVTNMSAMFFYCSSLTSLDVSNWDTSEVTNMSSIFQSCANLTTLDVSNWDTSKVTAMNSMFQGCSRLKYIVGIEKWDTGANRSMDSMFRAANQLTDIDVTNWDVKNVTTMNSAFRETAITQLNLSKWDTAANTNTGNMFHSCASLTYLDLSNWVINDTMFCNLMFYGCNSLQELRVTGWPLMDITQNMINTLPAGDDAKNIIYATVYFTAPSGWELVNLLEIARYTTNATGVLPTFNTGFTGYEVGTTDNGNGTYTIRIATNNLENMPSTIYFRGVSSLLTVEKIAVPGLTDISQMIEDCANVTYINVSDLDVSQVTNMYRALRRCNNLVTIDVTGWDTRNVTSLYGTFGNNPKLETIIGLEDWNVENVESFREICTGNLALQAFNIGNWRNSKNTTTYGMFYNCRALTALDMGGFDMGNITDTYAMFIETRGLIRFNSPTNIRTSIAFDNTQIDLESALDIIDNLAEVSSTQTLTLGSDILGLLTPAQIAVATNKGWDVN